MVSLTKESYCHENASVLSVQTGKVMVQTKWKGSFSDIIQSHSNTSPDDGVALIIRFSIVKVGGKDLQGKDVHKKPSRKPLSIL